MFQIVYVTTAFYFLLVYGLTLTSLFDLRWLIVSAPAPFGLEVTYGLGVSCSAFGNCRAFPQESQGDCDEDDVLQLDSSGSSSGPVLGYKFNFCGCWRAARFAAMAGAALGILILAEIFGVLCATSRARQQRAWKSITALFAAHALCYMFATGIIHYLREMSARFYFGTSFGSGFYMATAGWILDWFAVIALCMYGLFRSQQNFM
ncbi:hypothetical protein BDF19DRAFT_419294 [Syncephalis fuscata]|nr:hypothetical protein BDF19DRAFT_419294 [Syncephalis fuscata]